MKTKILMIILIVVISVIFLNINVVQASGISDVISGGDSFLQSASGTTIDEDKLKSSSEMIYNMLLVLGICIAVIVAAILGIKFMIGSMEEKAQVKEALIPFVVGCVVIFGAFGIWKIFVTIGNDVSDQTQLEIETETERVTIGSNTYNFEYGRLYCKKCYDIINSDDFSAGECLKCHQNKWNKKCGKGGCQETLSQNNFMNGCCSHGHSITNNPFIYYNN